MICKSKIMAVMMVALMTLSAVSVVGLADDGDGDTIPYKLYGVGKNNNGQQGDETTTDVTTPTQIGSSLGAISDVVCSNDTTFFLTSDGKLYGMGDNTFKQLGTADWRILTPTQIGSSLGTITDVVCSDNTTFFLTSDGKLYGMGFNNSGQQGNGTYTNVATPTQIGSSLGTITDVVCSDRTTFFLTSDGKLYGMGHNSSSQQGVSWTTTLVTTPTQIGSTLGTISDVVCSTDTTFFLTSDGKLYGMGGNGNGQQGNGTTTDVTTPTQIGSSLGTITDVVCSTNTTFFLTSDGKLYGMGWNNKGQQGNGTTTDVTTPTQIGSTLGTVTDVGCSKFTTFILGYAPSTYTLKYDLSGGTGTFPDQTYTGTDSTHTFTISSSEPTKLDYAFKGWATTSGSKTVAYDGGDTISVGADATVTLYAVYEPTGTLAAIKSMTDLLPLLFVVGIIIGAISLIVVRRM